MWLGAADVDIYGADGDKTIARRVDDGEFAGGEGERNGLGGAGGEVNALETGQGAERGAFDVGVGNIELDDFVAGDL